MYSVPFTCLLDIPVGLSRDTEPLGDHEGGNGRIYLGGGMRLSSRAEGDFAPLSNNWL